MTPSRNDEARWLEGDHPTVEQDRKADVEMTVAQHRDHFRGRCALALDHNADITRLLANAIRISPMAGCVDIGAIDQCRKHIEKMTEWLHEAEDSARSVLAGEAEEAKHVAF